jgi:hypothetical protein
MYFINTRPPSTKQSTGWRAGCLNQANTIQNGWQASKVCFAAVAFMGFGIHDNLPGGH